MALFTALSGVKAAQKDLDVASNNIANVSTFGFKGSRAEFSDVYTDSVFLNTKSATGSGTRTAAVAQQFGQGSLLFTENNMDLAISGGGFFVTSGKAEGVTDLDMAYTRSGAFKVDSKGNVIDNNGSFLRVLPVDFEGKAKALSLSSSKVLNIPQEFGEPMPTTEIKQGLTLPSNIDKVDPFFFDPSDPDTYNASTSSIFYDSFGQPHNLSTYYMKDDTAGLDANIWQMVAYVDNLPINFKNGAPVTEKGPLAVELNFDENGVLTSSLPKKIETVSMFDAGISMGGADLEQILDFQLEATQFGSEFNVYRSEQDGSSVGRLIKVEIANDGLIEARFSNGNSEFLGRVALVKFANEQGLRNVGGSAWKHTTTSGVPLVGTPKTGVYGTLESGALESSNVNLTDELMDLIMAQRNFQANSRAIEVDSTLQQSLIQIR